MRVNKKTIVDFMPWFKIAASCLKRDSMNSEFKAELPVTAKAVKLPSGVKWLQPFCV